MKLAIKYRIGEFKIYDGNNSLVGEIKKNLTSKRLEAWNADGKRIVSIFQEGQSLIVKEDGRETIKCPLLYQTSSADGVVRAASIRPPMPVEAVVATRWGKLLIDQNLPNKFRIFLNQEEIGTVSHILSFTKEININSQTIPLSYYCVIFSICFLMIHDNDIFIV